MSACVRLVRTCTEALFRVPSDCDKCYEHPNSLGILCVAVPQTSVLLDIIEETVLDIPASVHDEPYGLGRENRLLHRRCNVIGLRLLVVPCTILKHLPDFFNSKESQGLLHLTPHGKAFAIPNPHLIPIPRIVIVLIRLSFFRRQTRSITQDNRWRSVIKLSVRFSNN